MKKQRKYKNLKLILIPCFSILGLTCVVAPMVCLCTEKHVTFPFQYLFSGADPNTGHFSYTLNCLQPIKEDEDIKVDGDYMIGSSRTGKMTLLDKPIISEDRKSFTQNVIIDYLDDKKEAQLNFDFIITKINDNGEVVGQDRIKNLSIVRARGG